MKKRIVSMLIALVMAFTLLPTVALADGANDYILVSRDTLYAITEVDVWEGKNFSGDGWSWDAKTRALTLNGFKGEEIYFGFVGVKIVLAEGSVNEVDTVTISPGSYDSPGNVVIEGTGELLINNFSADLQYGPVTLAEPLELTGRRTETDTTWEPLTIANTWPSKLMTESGELIPSYNFKKIRIAPSVDADPKPSTPVEPVPSFTDVPAWCADAVNWAVANKVTVGTGNNKFSPGQDCSQVQILTFLWRAKKRPPCTTTAFSTLPGDYAPAAGWAFENGMVDNRFVHTESCTRAEAVWYIWMAEGRPPAAKTSSFKDVDYSAPIAEAINWAVENGIVEGYTDGTFRPDTVCNRGVIATMLWRTYVAEARLTAK